MKVQAVWTGFSGAPGYSNFYFLTTDPISASALAAANKVRTFFQEIRFQMVTGSSVEFPSVVQVLDDVTGNIEQEVGITAPAAMPGQAASQIYAAPAGAAVKWSTSTFRDGHKMVGRTYLVPLAGVALQNNGTLDDTVKATIATAALNLRTSTPTLVIYSRPRKAKAAERIDGSDAVSARVGLAAPVTASSVADKIAVLRSRRD
jgi:hypothetical protein